MHLLLGKYNSEGLNWYVNFGAFSNKFNTPPAFGLLVSNIQQVRSKFRRQLAKTREKE